MMNEQVFTNALIVTPQEVLRGSVCIRDGIVSDISESESRLAESIDLEGDFLCPGLVDLHTDEIERNFSPRPGVIWPSLPAVLAHDGQIASAGITTVFNAFSIGDVHDDSVRVSSVSEMIETVEAARTQDLLRVEHYTHLRCEVSYDQVAKIFMKYVDQERVRLVSLMDHTPGQRQFTRFEKYRQHYQGKYRLSDAEFERFVSEKLELQKQYAIRHRAFLVAECRARNVVLASHDDTTAAHIDEAIDDGVRVSEFPTTLEAARKARQSGMHVIAGAPNLVLGGSHSGNVAVMDLARHGLIDALASDYVPSSMMSGAFLLWEQGVVSDLSRAMAIVSSGPANIAGFDDRGEICVGKRADLVHVASHERKPIIKGAWCAGTRVF